jgi:hypothetical protein
VLTVLLTLACALRLVAAPVVIAFAECRESCPDDGPDGKCSLDCSDCVCCARPAAPPGRSATPELIPPSEMAAVAELELGTPPTPEPRKILHVPKRVLA